MAPHSTSVRPVMKTNSSASPGGGRGRRKGMMEKEMFFSKSLTVFVVKTTPVKQDNERQSENGVNNFMM